LIATVARVSVSSTTPSDDGPLPAAARLGIVGIVALSLGVLTAYAQEWLPDELGSLANSSGSWALVAFGLALLLATGVRNAAVIGSLALLALLVGYVLGAEARGYASGTGLIAFWGAAALLAGPLVGIGAFWVKSGGGLRPALGVGAMSGVLIGEGLYGLAFIADTTYPPYWWAETLVGALLAAWVVSHHPNRFQTAAVALAVGTLTVAAFLVVYSQDLIAVLP
jgi:hypothetical protein